MKIFIIPSWYPSRLHPESGSFFKQRAAMLENYGHEVTVVTAQIHSLSDWRPTRGIRLPQFSRDNNSQLPTFRYEALNRHPFMPRRFLANYRRKLIRLFKQACQQQGQPQVVMVNSSLWAGFALAEYLADLAIPFVVSEHLKEFIVSPGFDEYQQTALRTTYGKAAAIVATSPALADGITRHFPAFTRKIVHIANPVDTEFFHPPDRALSHERQFSLVAIALLRPEKRIDLLLRALALLKSTGLTLHLTVAGDGPERKALQRLTAKLKLENQVRFVGYCPPQQVRRHLENSHALVLPSDVETFGVALIEALACGRPVVATDCGGPGSIIGPENGILVEPGNAKALADGIRDLVNNYGKYSAGDIRQTTVDNYSPAVYGKVYTGLLEQISADSE